VDGKPVSNEDPRFKNKVVLAIVTGTWCPNCHDEAQYLVKLDKKYRDKGLAIVALDFEEPEQQGSLTRERAFVKQYGVDYTYLIAGAPAEMWEKVKGIRMRVEVILLERHVHPESRHARLRKWLEKVPTHIWNESEISFAFYDARNVSWTSSQPHNDDQLVAQFTAGGLPVRVEHFNRYVVVNSLLYQHAS